MGNGHRRRTMAGGVLAVDVRLGADLYVAGTGLRLVVRSDLGEGLDRASVFILGTAGAEVVEIRQVLIEATLSGTAGEVGEDEAQGQRIAEQGGVGGAHEQQREDGAEVSGADLVEPATVAGVVLPAIVGGAADVGLAAELGDGGAEGRGLEGLQQAELRRGVVKLEVRDFGLGLGGVMVRIVGWGRHGIFSF